MAYIGAVAPGYDPTRASVPQLDAERFNGNASTTAFTLTRQVVSPTDINVIVENVLQEPTVAYSVSGYTLNFTEAPPTGTNNIYVVYRGSGISNYAFVPDGSITYAKLANNIKQFTVDNFTANGTGSTVELTEAPASANAVIVSVDGVIQTAPTNYTLSGSTITFTGVPDSGANVVVKHIGFRTTSTVTALQASSVTATELADGSVTNAKIVSVANTKISGNIISSQITSVANTQITGNIISSQIAPSVILTTPIISGNLNLDSAGTTGVRVPSANTISFHTAGTEDMRIDATGNVGIGTTAPTAKLHSITTSGGTTTALGRFEAAVGGYTGTSLIACNTLGATSSYNLFSCITDSDGDAGGPVTEFLVRGDGIVMMGATTGPNYSERLKITFPNTQGIHCNESTNSSSVNYLYFTKGSGPTNVGAIYYNGSVMAYQTTSDYRLKENVTPITNALNKINLLKPVAYTWKDNQQSGEGFLAHELQEHFPDAVSGTKDEVDENGKPKYQGMDSSVIIATMVKAIQELKALNDTQAATITALTARIVALEP
jgi:hypothetical protein